MEKSPSDELYYKLFGEYPSKSGIALERLATIAYNEIMANKAWVDQRIKGRYSDSVYQLDGLIATNEGQKMLEAKDYSIRGSKVGRDDLQKLSGALLDIDNISKGVFASATDYTKPAKKYAESTIKMPNAKPIELYEIRPSTEEDEKGRVKKICIQMNIVTPDFNNGKYIPFFSKDAYKALELDGLLGIPINVQFDNFYDKNGNIKLTLLELTKSVSKEIQLHKVSSEINGVWELKNLYISLPNGKLYELDRIEYNIPIITDKEDIVIECNESPCLLIRSVDHKIDVLLTEEKLKKYKFEEDGTVTKN